MAPSTNPAAVHRAGTTGTDRGYPQRSCLAVRLGDMHPPHGRRSIRPLFQLLRQFTQPSLQPVRFDVLEPLFFLPDNGFTPSPGTGLVDLIGFTHLNPQYSPNMRGEIAIFGLNQQPLRRERAGERAVPARHRTALSPALSREYACEGGRFLSSERESPSPIFSAERELGKDKVRGRRRVEGAVCRRARRRSSLLGGLAI